MGKFVRPESRVDRIKKQYETSRLFTLCLAAALISADALAQEERGAFLQAEIGTTHFGSAFGENQDTTYSIGGGYFFNRNFGIEAGYRQLGESETPFFHERFTSYSLGVFGKKNFGDAPHTGAYISGHAGLARNHAKISMDGFPADEASVYRPYLGISAGYDFNPHFGIGLNMMLQEDVPLSFEGASYTSTGLELQYRF